MVAGQVPVRDGKVLFAGEAAVRTEAQVQAKKVARRVAADPVYKERAPLEAMKKDRLQGTVPQTA